MKKALLFLLICTGFNLAAQKTESGFIKLEIYQEILPDDNDGYQYVLIDDRLQVEKTRAKKNGAIKSKTVFSTPLPTGALDSLKKIISSENIEALKENYSDGTIDGIVWTFTIKTESVDKRIVLDNFYLPILDELLSVLNENLPKDRQYISFDFFGVKLKQ